MAEARRRGGDTPGILSVLVGIGFLVLLGFGLGVVAGLLVEEPDLVIDYAAGNTETVELPGEGADDSSVSAAPGTDSVEVAASAEPLVEGSGEAAPPRAQLRPAEPERRPPAHAAHEGFAVQVGAFAESAGAQALADRVRASGFDVYVSPSPPNAGPRRWRVRVGPVAKRSQAEELAERLKRQELPTWVLAEDAG